MGSKGRSQVTGSYDIHVHPIHFSCSGVLLERLRMDRGGAACAGSATPTAYLSSRL